MNRISARFKQLAQEQRKALITYVVAGDPQMEITVPVMHSLVKGGADIIELGVPFSDPSAEGPVIQRAHERALAHHTGLRHIFEMVREFRQTDSHTPVVLMGYANPIEWMGEEVFCQRAAEAGVDAVLTVDLPPEEAHPLNRLLEKYGLLNVFLLAPTTSENRIQTICNSASGFIYYVSLKGVTGSGHLDVGDVSHHVQQIKQHTQLPVCVGFGIKDEASAKAVATISDGVVVGSALVNLIAGCSDQSKLLPEVEQFVATLRYAID